jgi:PPOX class probable F420-dependent enzyme
VIPLRHPGRWIATAVVLVVLAQVVHGLVTNPFYQWDRFAYWFFRPVILDGLLVTLHVTAWAAVLGLLGGVVLALARLSRSPVLQAVSWGYVWLFRSIPLIVLLLFLYNFSALYERLGLGIPFGPVFVTFGVTTLATETVIAVLGLTLNEAAYAAEIVRAGILSVDQGQHEAAAALGFPRWYQFRRIVAPQALRSIVPNYVNLLISLVKSTSARLRAPTRENTDVHRTPLRLTRRRGPVRRVPDRAAPGRRPPPLPLQRADHRRRLQRVPCRTRPLPPLRRLVLPVVAAGHDRARPQRARGRRLRVLTSTAPGTAAAGPSARPTAPTPSTGSPCVRAARLRLDHRLHDVHRTRCDPAGLERPARARRAVPLELEESPMTTAAGVIPDELRDLLERPLIADLATVREDGTPQVNPMWFAWDGEFIRFTHTNFRRKYRDITANPAVAISIIDPGDRYRYIEVRGVVERIDPDPAGAFFVQLAERYDAPFGTGAPTDAPDRVVFVVRPAAVGRR